MQQPYPQQPFDPYRGPPRPAGFAPIGPTTRWVFAGIVSLMGLGFGAAVIGWTLAILRSENTPNHEPDPGLLSFGMIGLLVVVFLLYAQIAAGLTWVYKAWSWLPWDQRYAKNWRGWITPSQASLLLLVPYFHYYWMFVANAGLCDALDRLRVTYPTRHAAPRNLAIAACVCQIVIPFPVGSILWLVFMSKVERMTREMSGAMGPRSTNAF